MKSHLGIGAILLALVAGCAENVAEERVDDFALRIDTAEQLIETHIADFGQCEFALAVDVLELRLDQDYPHVDAKLLDSVEAISDCGLDDDEAELVSEAETAIDALHLYVRAHVRSHSHHAAHHQCEKDECQLEELMQTQIGVLRFVQHELRDTLRCRQ